MILIVAGAADAHVPWVTAKLDARQAGYVKFDPEDFPSKGGFSLHYDRSGGARRLLKHREGQTDASQVNAVWYRARPRIRPVPDAAVREELKWWVGESCARALTEFWECLDCLWLPGKPKADRDPYHAQAPPDRDCIPEQPRRLSAPSAYNKLYQLRAAGRLGFAVPRTLVTNAPDEFLDFYDECDGQVVAKSLYSMSATRDGEEVKPYTFALDRRGARAYRSIRYAPAIFQERVAKRLELRVTVVGRRVFAAAIGSQDASSRLKGDWRHYPEFEISRVFSEYHLPAGVEARCIDLVADLGLCFGAIDLILTPDGEYVFLEVNPNGQWAFVELLTGLPIADAIADMLIRGTA